MISSVADHLSHGDHEGDCPSDDDGKEKVLVCHIPPGNPENARTVRLPQSAVPAHLAHGDYLGECKSESRHPTPVPTNVSTNTPPGVPTGISTQVPTQPDLLHYLQHQNLQ